MHASFPGSWGVCDFQSGPHSSLSPQSKDGVIEFSVTISQADRPCQKAGTIQLFRSEIDMDLPCQALGIKPVFMDVGACTGTGTSGEPGTQAEWPPVRIRQAAKSPVRIYTMCLVGFVFFQPLIHLESVSKCLKLSPLLVSSNSTLNS